eukprot:2207652-Alexandrium_andersonii.AAC.1
MGRGPGRDLVPGQSAGAEWPAAQGQPPRGRQSTQGAQPPQKLPHAGPQLTPPQPQKGEDRALRQEQRGCQPRSEEAQQDR